MIFYVSSIFHINSPKIKPKITTRTAIRNAVNKSIKNWTQKRKQITFTIYLDNNLFKLNFRITDCFKI